MMHQPQNATHRVALMEGAAMRSALFLQSARAKHGPGDADWKKAVAIGWGAIIKKYTQQLDAFLVIVFIICRERNMSAQKLHPQCFQVLTRAQSPEPKRGSKEMCRRLRENGGLEGSE